MFNSILCAVDGSEPSKRAIEAACDLTEKYGSDLHLIHAYDYAAFLASVAPETSFAMMSQEDFKKPREETLKNAEDMAEELGCQNLSAHLVNAGPARAILEKAEEIGAQLIILGTRGHSDIASLLLGSVSHKVCNTAKCACLLVH